MFKQYLSEDDIKHDGNNVKESFVQRKEIALILNPHSFKEERPKILLDFKTFKLKQRPWNRGQRCWLLEY